ncbi:MAG: ABC transporter ATP-binding protein/permease [Treponema sp.]|jgi:ATP-binding cassette subfamily B protein|nr:ABC transporter ATP-binding protein/permease [Treponema sp.]
MSDYFETDEITKEYDGRLVKRILSYLKPCRLLVFLTLFALALSTLGELYIPILQQRVIDEVIISRRLAINTSLPAAASPVSGSGGEGFDADEGLDAGERAVFEELIGLQGTIQIGEWYFVPQNHRSAIQTGLEGKLRNLGILDSEQWYAFGFGEDHPALAVMERRGGLFLKNESAAAIKTADLYSLPAAEISAVRSNDISRILRQGIVFFAVLILVFVFTFSQTWTTNLMSQRVMKDMRLELFRKTASQSTAFLSKHPVGRIVTRLTGDMETINEFFTTVLIAFLKDLSVMAGALVTLFILSPKLALIVLAILPPVLALTLVSRVKARDAFRRQRIASSKVYSYFSERLAGVQVVQLFRGEKKSRREFAGCNREFLDANLGEMYVFATFRPLVEWFATFTTAALIVAGSRMVLSLSLSLGVLIAFISLVQMFYSPVMDIAEKYTLLQSAMAGGERVFKLLDTDERIPDRGTRSVKDTIGGRIEFEDVRFSYKEGEEVLKGLSFGVRPGEMAAIVGYTGAGKTTIINVLTRLWDVDSGLVRIDGVPVKDIPLDELRGSVLPVLQDVFLFSGTVADNISLGLDLDEERIIDAAKAVHAHGFISALPEGYETMLSEGAANISSGQRQLISFARVIAHNPRIVILDEATSSVDTETERLIQLGMQRVLAGRTSIVIAHRLSTIKNADRILVLSGGRLVEEGRHEELIKKNGLYAGLYRLQFS